METTLNIYESDNVPCEIYEAARPYELKFGVKFSRFYVFPKNLFCEINSNFELPRENGKLLVASDTDEKIRELFPVLTKAANSSLSTPELRKRYFEALSGIYSQFSRKPIGGPTVLTVAPEREGRILAQRMGWFVGSAIAPNLKRIPYQSGLVVGLSGLDIKSSFEECNIIDGAIASGATLITVMHSLKDHVRRFHIYSVHAAFQGIRALFRMAYFLKIDISITVGHATDGLNNKYYAIVEEQPNILQVGDLGDMIAILPDISFNQGEKNSNVNL